MKTQVKLIAKYGCLYSLFDAIVDDLVREHFRQCGLTNPFKPKSERGHPDNPILLVEHEGGDHDTIAWPLIKRGHLASALFDARESGIIPDVAEVILPDGGTFDIDRELEQVAIDKRIAADLQKTIDEVSPAIREEDDEGEVESRYSLRDEGRSDGQGESYAERNT